MNSTDIGTKGLTEVEMQVKALSNEINVPYVTGSDSHFPIQLGSVMTKFKEDFNTVEDIKRAINQGDYEIHASRALDLKVFSAKTTKRVIKEEIIKNDNLKIV